MFENGAIRIGEFFRITVRVHVLFFLLIAYWLITAGDWRLELAFCVMLFGSVLLHEFGHCFGARSVGGDADNILMWPLGGLAYAHAPMRPWPQFVTVAAGPLVNVLLMVISAAILFVATGAWVVSLNPFAGPAGLTAEWQFYVWQLFWLNQLLLYFNLLPVFPLDGGQLLRTLMWPALGLQRATIVASMLGVGGAIVLGGMGLMWERYMLLAIALFGGMTSLQHYQAARAGMLVEDSLPPNRPPRRRREGEGVLSGVVRRRKKTEAGEVNPNPGGWQDRVEEELALEREIDRILQKVHEEGIHSLSYVERQKLENATRRRRDQERDFERENRL